MPRQLHGPGRRQTFGGNHRWQSVLLAFIRKRSFLDIGRERLAGLVQLEMDAVEYGSELLLG